jgi:AraC family transcriptional regulator
MKRMEIQIPKTTNRSAKSKSLLQFSQNSAMHPPTITRSSPRLLLGIRIQTNLAENRAPELWRTFRPRVAEIQHRAGGDFFDVKRYGTELTNGQFTPATVFEKWAAVEVTDFDHIPEGMEALDLPGGWYAVFVHRGPASAFGRTYQYIFATWLPQSGYRLDQRPHYEIMGPAYRPDDPEAEEEVWVPIH